MDNLRHQPYSESLKTTLNCYQLSSLDSLSGPSGLSALTAKLWFKDNKQAPPVPPPPLIQMPLLIPNDTSTQRSETTLAGQRVACFIVGGEKRLCLPQILTTVLRDFSISEINKTCSELHIFCSTCSPEQLEILKVLGILPFNTTTCGLITKTDAERLVSTLGVEFHLNSRYSLKDDIKGVKVYHECFGRGDGIFYSELYTSPDAPCIMCIDCRICLSPARFVNHSHRGLEKHTCHWGFDPENWRNYLLLPKDTDKCRVKDLETTLSGLKARFDYDGSSSQKTTPTSPILKRQHESEQELPRAKKFKDEKLDDLSYLSSLGVPPFYYGLPFGLRPSAFKPWSTGLAANLAQLPEFRAAQDEALMKALAPMVQDSRMLPGYLQFVSPALFPTVEPPINWNSSLSGSEKTASGGRLTSSEQQKRTTDAIARSEKGSDASAEKSERRSFTSVSSYGTTAEASSREFDESAAKSRRISSDTFRQEKSTNRPSLDASSQSEGSRNPVSKQTEREPEITGRRRSELEQTNSRDEGVAAQKSPSISDDALSVDRTVPPLLAMSKAVAAASAMLELSSAANEKRTFRDKPDKTSSTDLESSRSLNAREAATKPSESPPTAKARLESPFLQVIPLSETHEHFKWTLGSSSHIISATGTQELQLFNSMLETASVESKAKQQILYELVKMKSRYEERLDIQERVKKDLEAECDRVKSSKKQQLKEAAAVRQEMQQEMEVMRVEHCRKVEELHEKMASLERKLEKVTSPSSSPRSEVDDNQQVMNSMRKQIQEKDIVLSQLRMDLIAERDKRLAAEMKLDEMMDRSRGRMSFLMDEALSSMIRGSRKSNGEIFNRNRQPNFPASRKSLETLVSTVYGHNSATSPNAVRHDANGDLDRKSLNGSTSSHNGGIPVTASPK